MVREIGRTFPDSDLMDTWTWFQSGINTDGAHKPVTARRLVKGDILSLSCFPMIAGYYRVGAHAVPRPRLGCASQMLRDQCRSASRRAGLERPSIRGCDIALKLNEIYRRHGVPQYRKFVYGHSFGVLCHYFGREAGIALREDIETVLEPGMVISVEPMIMIPEEFPGAGGYRGHDIIIVTGDGAENITKFRFGSDYNIDHR